MNPSSEQFLCGRHEQFPCCEVICGARRCEPLTVGEAALRVPTGPSEAPSSRTSAPSQVSLFPDKRAPTANPSAKSIQQTVTLGRTSLFPDLRPTDRLSLSQAANLRLPQTICLINIHPQQTGTVPFPPLLGKGPSPEGSSVFAELGLVPTITVSSLFHGKGSSWLK